MMHICNKNFELITFINIKLILLLQVLWTLNFNFFKNLIRTTSKQVLLGF